MDMLWCNGISGWRPRSPGGRGYC